MRAPDKKSKRENVQQEKKKKQKSIIIISISAVLAIAILISITLIQNNLNSQTPIKLSELIVPSSTPSNKGVSYTEVSGRDGKIEFSTADFQDSMAKYYQYNSSGKEVYFFVLKSSDGIIRAAFDACDVCYEARLGYRQEGDLMVCNNCGRQFPSVRINVEEGGCNPAPLER